MENLLKDLGFGLRQLAARPAFTAVAVLSLALGIGLNTVMFSVVNAVLLAPTAVREPERLVEIYTSQAADMPYLTTSTPTSSTCGRRPTRSRASRPTPWCAASIGAGRTAPRSSWARS